MIKRDPYKPASYDEDYGVDYGRSRPTAYQGVKEGVLTNETLREAGIEDYGKDDWSSAINEGGYSYGGGGDYFTGVEPYQAPESRPSGDIMPSRPLTFGGDSSSTTTTELTPTMESPKYGGIPEYDVPEYDEGQVSGYAEEAMGVPLSQSDEA